MEEATKPSPSGSGINRALKAVFQGFIVVCLVDGFLDISYPLAKYAKKKFVVELSRVRKKTAPKMEVIIPMSGLPLRREPGIRGIPTEYKSPHINITTEGRRLNGLRPMAGSRKVFLLGSSTAFGYGVKDGQTISSQLERELEGVHVDNYAGVAQTTSSTMLRLYDLKKKYTKPNLAIIAGINYQIYEECNPRQPIYFARHSNVFHHLVKVATGRREENVGYKAENQCVSNDSIDLAVKSSVVSVESAVSFGRKMGSPFYLVYLPTPFEPNVKIDNLITSEDAKDFALNMQKVYTKYRKELKKLDIPELVDLSEVLPPGKEYFIDLGGHLSAEGNLIVAKALAQHLNPIATSRSISSFTAPDVRVPLMR